MGSLSVINEPVRFGFAGSGQRGIVGDGKVVIELDEDGVRTFDFEANSMSTLWRMWRIPNGREILPVSSGESLLFFMNQERYINSMLGGEVVSF
jgi:hypothetical protein